MCMDEHIEQIIVLPYYDYISNLYVHVRACVCVCVCVCVEQCREEGEKDIMIRHGRIVKKINTDN